MTLIQRMAAGVCLAVVSLAAMAGGTATLESGGNAKGTMKLYWSGGSLKLVPEGEPGYMVVRDNKVYAVSQVQGRTMVVDMAAMAAMAKGMNKQAGGAAPEMTGDDIATLDSREATGGKETVAGIQGEVYNVTWTDGNGKQHSDQTVLSDDPRVVDMTRSFHAMASAMRTTMGKDGPDPMGQELLDRGLGMLRFGDDMKLTSISGDTPAASEFELPAEPMKIPGMPSQ
jgi:hypothetical protein